MQEAFKKVEKDAFRFASENERLKKTIESMQEELDNLRKDASVMRSILDRAAISVAPQAADAIADTKAKAKYIPKAAVKQAEVKKEEPVVEQLSAFDEPAEAEEAAPAVEEEAPKAPKAPAGKSRVGGMFDLLFEDINA